MVVCLLAQACFWAEEPPLFEVTGSDDNFDVHYEWNYRGSRWQYDTQIPRSTYEYFADKKRTASYAEYVLNPLDDEWMGHVADLFTGWSAEKGWGDWDAVSFVLSFVHSMPYTSDKVSTGYDEYPRYPVETIVDGGGDCEDTAILFASIIREMDYGVVLLKLEEDAHMAVGVLVSQDVVDNWRGRYPLTYYTTDEGEIYAYCETTGDGWELGHKPEDLVSQTAEIIDVS